MFDLQQCYDAIKEKASIAQAAARAQAVAVSGTPQEAAQAAAHVVGWSFIYRIFKVILNS